MHVSYRSIILFRSFTKLLMFKVMHKTKFLNINFKGGMVLKQTNKQTKIALNDKIG